MKYKGSCHCQAVQFEFQAENIESALQCNCSICIRKNAIMTKQKIEPAQFKLIKGEEALSNYLWGDKDVNHYFCRHCGIFPFVHFNCDSGTYRVNLGCVEGVEPRTLDIVEFDGRNLL